MKKINRILQSQNGNVIVIVAIAMVALIGLSALVIDGGRMFSEKSDLQNAVDAAVLAGAQKLPDDKVEAESIAKQIALDNLSNRTVSIEVEIPTDGKFIRVTATENVSMTLANVLNVNNTDIVATAKVIVNPLTSYSGRGIVPFGINLERYNALYEDLEDLEQGDLIELKWGDSESGNFGALSINGAGAQNFLDALINGSDREINVGDIFDTETGDMAGPTEQGLEGTNSPNDELGRFESCTDWEVGDDVLSHIEEHPSCPRIVITPIYEPYLVDNNQIKQVKILGFASMFVTDVRTTGNDKGVDGVFLELTQSGGSSELQANYGTYGYTLVE